MAECASLFVKDRLTKGTLLWDASLTQLKTHSVGSEEVDFHSVNWSNWQSNCRLWVLRECAAPLWRADSVLLHPNCLPTEKKAITVLKNEFSDVVTRSTDREIKSFEMDRCILPAPGNKSSYFRPKHDLFLNLTEPREQSGHLKSCQLLISKVWYRSWLGSDRTTDTRTSHPGLCRTRTVSCSILI